MMTMLLHAMTVLVLCKRCSAVLGQVPYIRQLLDSFGVPVSRSRFMRIEPGNERRKQEMRPINLSSLRSYSEDA